MHFVENPSHLFIWYKGSGSKGCIVLFLWEICCISIKKSLFQLFCFVYCVLCSCSPWRQRTFPFQKTLYCRQAVNTQHLLSFVEQGSWKVFIGDFVSS